MLKKLILIAVCIFCAGNFLCAQKKAGMVSKNVCVLDTAFPMPQLNRSRRVWIYLPESYCNTKKKYPVLYMQDGQNLFDEATAFAGEWGVDETLDAMSGTVPECIVVAIDNGGPKRMNEYAPYDTEKFGKGEGEAYVEFMVKTLKPFIDKQYRTKKSRKHTFVAGSSMGALISFYALLKYPDKFGGAGLFSPAFWAAPQLQKQIEASAKKVKGKIYFYVGKGEGEETLQNMLSVFEMMDKHSKAKMTTVIRTEGKHNEASWRAEFPLFYKWIMTQ